MTVHTQFMARMMHKPTCRHRKVNSREGVMNTKRKSFRLLPVIELFWKAMASLADLTFPEHRVFVPVSAARRFESVRGRRTSMTGAMMRIAAFFLAIPLLAASPGWAAQTALPSGVPNIFDPDVRAKFQPVAVVNLRGDPDFPVLVLVNTVVEDGKPQAMLLGLDARNGKETWSLATDPIILIVLFADPFTIMSVHVDVGFSEAGRPSGDFQLLDAPDASTLPDLLRAVTPLRAQTYL